MWTQAFLSGARASGSHLMPSGRTTMPVRWTWQAVVRRRRNPKTGKSEYENWDRIVMGFQEPSLLSGTSLLDRHLNQEEHIKPTEMKRRLNNRKVHDRLVKRVDDLTNYIKFMKDHKE
jgi:hypothetical protein